MWNNRDILSLESFNMKRGQTDWIHVFSYVKDFWSSIYPRYKCKERHDGEPLLDLKSEDDQQHSLRIEVGIDGKLDLVMMDGIDVTEMCWSNSPWDDLVRLYYFNHYNIGEASSQPGGYRQSPVSTSNKKGGNIKKGLNDTDVVIPSFTHNLGYEPGMDFKFLQDEEDEEDIPTKDLTPGPIQGKDNLKKELGDVPSSKGVVTPSKASRKDGGSGYGQRNRQKK